MISMPRSLHQSSTASSKRFIFRSAEQFAFAKPPGFTVLDGRQTAHDINTKILQRIKVHGFAPADKLRRR